MTNEFEEMVNSAVLDKQSVFDAIERINYYINHYQKLLSYAKKTVKQRKIQEELTWWKIQLVEHEEMSKTFQ